jgi:hypothetical protein
MVAIALRATLATPPLTATATLAAPEKINLVPMFHLDTSRHTEQQTERN